MIPVSVIVTVKNEAQNIGRCLAALGDFDEVVVVDSHSEDGTAAIAAQAGAQVEQFRWNGRYPKKRQWCLDHLSFRHDWVFFVDADEIVTDALVREIEALFAGGSPGAAGYFVPGRYVLGGRPLRFGLRNNKLCLFDRRKMMFPVIDDLDLPGMGEIEGHYQPVLQSGHEGAPIGQIRAPLLHYAYDENWQARHKRYAAWEAAMNARQAWPRDPVQYRERLKRLFRSAPGRGLIAFAHCYFWKGGILDGRAGLAFALSRYRYYRLITAAASGASKGRETGVAAHRPRSDARR